MCIGLSAFPAGGSLACRVSCAKKSAPGTAAPRLMAPPATAESLMKFLLVVDIFLALRSTRPLGAARSVFHQNSIFNRRRVRRAFACCASSELGTHSALSLPQIVVAVHTSDPRTLFHRRAEIFRHPAAENTRLWITDVTQRTIIKILFGESAAADGENKAQYGAEGAVMG